MSIQTEITRLQGLRNTLRAALVALGLAQSAADLEDCVTAVEGIKNNGAVSGAITDAATPYNVPAGYHNGQGTVGIANTEKEKLVAGNIKSGVTILGVAPIPGRHLSCRPRLSRPPRPSRISPPTKATTPCPKSQWRPFRRSTPMSPG